MKIPVFSHFFGRMAVVFASGAVAMPAGAGLNVGAKAPEFEAQAALAGAVTTFRLSEALKGGPVVVYFYPSAYTPGCNIQAHTFSENMGKFSDAGAKVIGISLDSIERLKKFSADKEYCAGKVAVASDKDGSIAKAYGLQVKEGSPGDKDTKDQPIGHGFAERVTFVVNSQGAVVSKIGGVPAAENVKQALAAVEKLAFGK
jgi:peroxiredoxin Q/BCP